MVAASAACLLAAAVLAAAFNPATAWIAARGTFFGRDAWSLHEGACGYGFVCPNRWSDELVSGRDVVAISDQSDLYKAGYNCGQCVAIRCRDGSVTDGNGVTVDRSGSQYCKAGKPVVKVKITDRCDCNYGPNKASNARWCCADGVEHFDVSQWAMEKIAKDTSKWGVFALEYEKVDCKASIENEAPAVPLSKQAADPHAGMQKGTNCEAQSVGSPGSSGSGGALRTQSASASRASATTSTSAKRPTYNWKAWLAKKRSQRSNTNKRPTYNWRRWLAKKRAQRGRKLMAA